MNGQRRDIGAGREPRKHGGGARPLQRDQRRFVAHRQLDVRRQPLAAASA